MIARLVEALTTSGAPVVGAGVSAPDSLPQLLTAPAGHEADRFEIGSITKTMTGTVLADLIVGGDVQATDTVDRWLDVHDSPAAKITLEQLATHTSGLPRMSPNWHDHPDYDPEDPYATYGPQEAEAGLRAIDALDQPGSRAYSNFGFQLLGLCLERAAGRPLDELFRVTLFDPLTMSTATTANLTDDVLVGTHEGRPTGIWHIELLGPGGVVATLDDLLRYGRAVLDPPDGRLGDAIRLATAKQLGWSLSTRGVIWHNGGTAGCRSMLAISPDHDRVATAFVTTGGFDDADAAAMAVALGHDPFAAMPRPLDGTEREPYADAAVNVASQLQRGDLDGVRAAMARPTAEVITIDRLLGGRAAVIEPHLPLEEPVVQEVMSRANGVHVRLVARSSATTATVTTLVVLDEKRRVVGLNIS